MSNTGNKITFQALTITCDIERDIRERNITLHLGLRCGIEDRNGILGPSELPVDQERSKLLLGELLYSGRPIKITLEKIEAEPENNQTGIHALDNEKSLVEQVKLLQQQVAELQRNSKRPRQLVKPTKL